jgi:hypothetical protein
MRQLSFGIMCTGMRFTAWQARTIESLLDLDGVSAELLILDDEAHGRSLAARVERMSRSLARLARRRGRLWLLYERVVVRRSLAERPVDLSLGFSDVPAITCRPLRRDRYSQYFSKADIDLIRSFDLDFILRFAFGIIRGDILTTPRFGVWSFHHGDETKYRGKPAGFWEIVKHEPVTGAVLQRLTDRLDAGIILRRGSFPTLPTSWIRNRDQVRLGSADWPARVCEDIRSGAAASYIDADPSATEATIMRRPCARDLVRYLVITSRSAWKGRRSSLSLAQRGRSVRGS